MDIIYNNNIGVSRLVEDNLSPLFCNIDSGSIGDDDDVDADEARAPAAAADDDDGDDEFDGKNDDTNDIQTEGIFVR
ncbi:hypothetical protein DPMN_166964 [Dreissena polymorpha]|uniref:Uncharacterized protein n=1 Tax=Dreissena polymorpha TaxID=45954 RepID=A0A9D4EYY2_DREPO|nr:hypothetical protein DPMN_166964 [Dreissena polymorpha]